VQVLYALALVPVGLLADRVDRPRLLAAGIALWSLLTMTAAQAQSFGQVGGSGDVRSRWTEVVGRGGARAA
jgi:MFS family permease